MGWTSTADPLSNAAMYFDSAEQAVRFAQRHGWPFEVMAWLVGWLAGWLAGWSVG